MVPLSFFGAVVDDGLADEAGVLTGVVDGGAGGVGDLLHPGGAVEFLLAVQAAHVERGLLGARALGIPGGFHDLAVAAPLRPGAVGGLGQALVVGVGPAGAVLVVVVLLVGVAVAVGVVLEDGRDDVLVEPVGDRGRPGLGPLDREAAAGCCLSTSAGMLVPQMQSGSE
jgi:hypothetical protein